MNSQEALDIFYEACGVDRVGYEKHKEEMTEFWQLMLQRSYKTAWGFLTEEQKEEILNNGRE